MWLAREAMEAGRLGAIDVRELMEDATQVALLDQERAGIDIVTRARWAVSASSSASTIASRASTTSEAPRKLGQPLWDTNTPFEVTEKIAAPAGLGIVEEFKLARALHEQAHQGHGARPLHAARAR